MISDNTPVIVGVAQVTERIDSATYRGLSPVELAAQAATNACMDATGSGACIELIDVLGSVRTVEDSTPLPAVFGKPNNFPRAVAKRLSITPRDAILTKAGGTSPLSLLVDLGGRIHKGVNRCALIVGAEAMSTARHLAGRGETRDWSETVGGSVENHGRGLAQMQSRYASAHRVSGAPASYALLENARRAELGLSRDEYMRQMGNLFAPFTDVAARNPYSSSAIAAMTSMELIEDSVRNRWVADPYRLKLVARDQVNQSTAVMLMSVGLAKELNIAEERWVFLHASAIACEPHIIERRHMGRSPAAGATLESVLSTVDKSVADITYFDFYSCFPIPVFAAAVDALRLSPDDPRGLTVTGGLPYFGGPGNNYSMHAIATMTTLLRKNRNGFGLIGFNGGILSKYGAAILSAISAPWPESKDAEVQRQLDSAERAAVVRSAEGWARIVTYTVVYAKGVPSYAIVIGARERDGARFYANNMDAVALESVVDDDPIGRRIYVRSTGPTNQFAFTKEAMDLAFPVRPPGFRDAYEFSLIERRGHVLEVTINRPDVRNALTPQAHQELAEIFDAYEADSELWAAIITGAGDIAFCSGNDLKYGATGSPMWVPDSGFAGLTNRSGRCKPIIAAVNGLAYGGGMEICLACDLVVADEFAKLALPEVRVGLIAGVGGAVRLPRQIPKKIALELLLTGRQLDAGEARQIGIVNRIAASGTVMGEARALANELIDASPTSIRLTMQVMAAAENHASSDQAMTEAMSSPLLDELMFSEDAAEGIRAFAEKRKPQWRNR